MMRHLVENLFISGRQAMRSQRNTIACVVGSAVLLLGGVGSNARAGYAEQVVADGAIHYWRFEETETSQPARDEIPGRAGDGDMPAQTNAPGTYRGGVLLGQPSAFPALGTAVRFDEPNGTHVALGKPQHPGNSISVEAWVLLDSSHTVGYSPIIARWDGSYELDVNHAGQGGQLDFVIRNDTNAFIDPHSEQSMTTDAWHHVVGVFAGEADGGGGTGIVYLDGVRQVDVQGGGNLRNAGGDDGQWYIGRTRRSSSGYAWRGLIDEVAIYPYALTAEQIARHVELAKGVVGPVGDFNANGQLDVVDIDLLASEIRSGANRAPYDLNRDQMVNGFDQRVWVVDLRKTWYGDANLDGLFNTSDLVTVFQAGLFESTGDAGWGQGDWNGDSRFNSGDLVAAFQDGGFERGNRPDAAVVPEPSSVGLLAAVCGLPGIFRRCRRRE